MRIVVTDTTMSGMAMNPVAGPFERGSKMPEDRLEREIATWRLPDDRRPLLDRIESMVRPALFAGHFGVSFTRFVCGFQYHLGGEQDTRELADLAHVTRNDHILDVCCFLGGPAVQLAHQIGCKVTGVDVSVGTVVAANCIAGIAGLSDLARFVAADASSLPFPDASFSVVWCQGSLEHNQGWLSEFDRVLKSHGRLALTFQTRGPSAQSPGGPFSRWTLSDLEELLLEMGYKVERAQDITERDIEIGWKALDRKLTRLEGEFARALGEEWVHQAHRSFHEEIVAMRSGKWGNGRIIAAKT